MLGHWRARMQQYRQHRRVFSRHRDIWAYRQLRDNPTLLAGPVALRLRGAGDMPLLCRPGTMDPITLWDVFFFGYHLPSEPLQEPRCIVDLGANAGYTTANFAALYPRARIIAVEMDSTNLALCSRNSAHFRQRCQVVHAAIWATAGTVRYGGSDVHAYRIATLDGAQKEVVGTAPALTMGEIFERNGVIEVDYLKMDIEGAEAQVLNGAIPWADRVIRMGVELHPPATYEECRDVLQRAGFVCQKHPVHPNGLFATRLRA